MSSYLTGLRKTTPTLGELLEEGHIDLFDGASFINEELLEEFVELFELTYYDNQIGRETEEKFKTSYIANLKRLERMLKPRYDLAMHESFKGIDPFLIREVLNEQRKDDSLTSSFGTSTTANTAQSTDTYDIKDDTESDTESDSTSKQKDFSKSVDTPGSTVMDSYIGNHADSMNKSDSDSNSRNKQTSKGYNKKTGNVGSDAKAEIESTSGADSESKSNYDLKRVQEKLNMNMMEIVNVYMRITNDIVVKAVDDVRMQRLFLKVY